MPREGRGAKKNIHPTTAYTTQLKVMASMITKLTSCVLRESVVLIARWQIKPGMINKIITRTASIVAGIISPWMFPLILPKHNHLTNLWNLPKQSGHTPQYTRNGGILAYPWQAIVY